MAKILNKGYDVTNETSLVTAAVGLDFATDFRVKEETPKEVKLVNITSPLDRPEVLRFAYSEVADVYKNTSIDKTVYAPTTKGVQILAQVMDTFSLTDDTDASYRVDLPVSAHLVIKVPANENISIADIQGIVNRLNGCLFEGKTTATARLDAILRGSLTPSAL